MYMYISGNWIDFITKVVGLITAIIILIQITKK
jgi:hypothetical protein